MVCVLLKDSGEGHESAATIAETLHFSSRLFLLALLPQPRGRPSETCLPRHRRSICVSLTHTHAVIHTLPSVSHNVYITFAQPTAGNRQQENTQLTASLCTSIYSTEKKNAAGTDSLTPSWNFPILDVTDKNEHHKNDTYSGHLYSCIT